MQTSGRGRELVALENISCHGEYKHIIASPVELIKYSVILSIESTQTRLEDRETITRRLLYYKRYLNCEPSSGV